MRDARLIGLYSPTMQSGKSTVASMLVERGFTVVKFATPLKMMTGMFLKHAGIPDKDLWAYVDGDLKEKAIPGLPPGTTSRKIQRTLGKEWGREHIGGNLWADIAINRARALMREGRSVIIDDMRFPNEYKLILEQGGEVWRVSRTKGRKYKSDGHSEALLEDKWFDVRLENTGSISDLKARISAILELGVPPGELTSK